MSIKEALGIDIGGVIISKAPEASHTFQQNERVFQVQNVLRIT